MTDKKSFLEGVPICVIGEDGSAETMTMEELKRRREADAAELPKLKLSKQVVGPGPGGGTIHQVRPTPFPSEVMRDGAICPFSCNRVHVEGDEVVAFHTTTAEAAARMLAGEPPQATSPAVGFAQPRGTAGFWLNCVPWMPYCLDEWAPHIGQEMAILVVRFPLAVADDRLEWPHVWPFIQWSIRPEEVLSLRMMEPAEFLGWRGRKGTLRIAKFANESDNPRNAYVDELSRIKAKFGV